MKKLIFDCDNTFGVPGCDIDDGLALLYLLSTGKAELLGITTTYGNHTLDTVDATTRHMLWDIGREDIPVYRGSAQAGSTDGQAAEFLCTMADRFPGELCILATGSMTNLHAAYTLDSAFFEKVSEVSIMGGITESLVIGGRVLEELNLSCDPAAALCVLTQAKRLLVATGNACLDAFFTYEQFKTRLDIAGSPFAAWLRNHTEYWFKREKEVFGHEGIYQWDVYAAAALLEPEWFTIRETEIMPTIKSLQTGNLLGGQKPVRVNIPRVRNPNAFTDHIYDTYVQNSFAVKGEK